MRYAFQHNIFTIRSSSPLSTSMLACRETIRIQQIENRETQERPGVKIKWTSQLVGKLNPVSLMCECARVWVPSHTVALLGKNPIHVSSSIPCDPSPTPGSHENGRCLCPCVCMGVGYISKKWSEKLAQTTSKSQWQFCVRSPVDVLYKCILSIRPHIKPPTPSPVGRVLAPSCSCCPAAWLRAGRGQRCSNLVKKFGSMKGPP